LLSVAKVAVEPGARSIPPITDSFLNRPRLHIGRDCRQFWIDALAPGGLKGPFRRVCNGWRLYASPIGVRVAMSFCFSKSVAIPLETAAELIAAIMERHGMSVLSNIDVNGALKRQLAIDGPGYRIISASHPGLAGGPVRSDGTPQPLFHCRAVLNEADDGAVQIVVSGGLNADGADSGAISIAGAAETLLRQMFSESGLAVAA
jgi:uncharacterized protein (DUF302 family)